MTTEIDDTPTTDIADEPTPFEHGMALIDQTLADISGTSITQSSSMVDVLLDLRGCLQKTDEAVRLAVKIWATAARSLHFYKETFGDLEVPEDWMPSDTDRVTAEALR